MSNESLWPPGEPKGEKLYLNPSEMDAAMRGLFTKLVAPRRGFKRDLLTLDQAMEFGGVAFNAGVEPWVKYDPNVDPHFVFKRSHATDGTLALSQKFMLEMLRPLLARYMFYKPEPLPEGTLPFYTVGRIRVASVFGRVELKAGTYPGMRESISIPVRVHHKGI